MSAELLASRNVTVFLYNFDYFSVFDPWEGAKHGAELFYLSGYPLSGHHNFRYDQTDKSMSTRLMQMWANFAQNGLPTLLPHQDFHMSPYTASQRTYTQITSRDAHVSMSTQTAYKQDKMAFWNQHVPKLYIAQLRTDIHLINDTLNYDTNQLLTKDIFTKGTNEESMKKSPIYTGTHTSGNWVLIAACIGLCSLTVLLSVCYCRVKRQVKTLIRQTSINSGEPIL
uniref:Carboxylesterase type B domain-containing protein n=1 Tax=Arion vulgaris TaxID=1028688 RepID=A0A0B7A4G9_9EUPU